MTKKYLLLTSLFAFLLALASACGSSSIVGKWQGVGSSHTTIEFTPKGDIIIKDGNFVTAGTYQLVGSDVIKVKADSFGTEMSQAWSYSINGDNLTLTGYSLLGGKSTFVRLKADGSAPVEQASTKTQPNTNVATVSQPNATKTTVKPPPSVTVVSPNPQQAAADELKAVQSAVFSMMVDNSMANLKVTRNVGNATSDMSVFPGGSAVLYGNKMSGTTVNYFATNITRGFYAVDALGTVTQITTGY